MRNLWIVFCLTLAAWGAGPVCQEPPAPPEAAKPKDQFFAGYITDLSASAVTVTRTVLGGKTSTRTFAITPETRIEGKAKIKSRVTVQYVAAEGGDRAVQIIVRSPSAKKPS